MSAFSLKRFNESRSTNRYSVGEILSNIKLDKSSDQRPGPPVDFSFCAAKKMSDISRATPRKGLHPYMSISVTISEEDIPKKKHNEDNENEVKRDYNKYITNSIKLSSNSLSSFDGLERMLEAVLSDPSQLQWIDLSFNDFANIDEVLLNYKSLKVIYLHGNVIEDICEIDKLALLPQLRTLTLHGNIFENEKGYRCYIISRIPQLQFLDFSRVTKADRDKARTWTSMRLLQKKRRKTNNKK